MKRLGIDLGSSSCGWAIREENEIVNKGVVTFSTGMVKGTGGYSSPTQDRRKARSRRRLLQARKYRKWSLLQVLIEQGMVPLTNEELKDWSKYQKGRVRKFPESYKFQKWLACDFTYQGETKFKNPYRLRVKGLDSELTKHELGRALYHLVQRRGYKDIGEKDKETKKQIERRKGAGFEGSLHENRTIAEALLKDFLDKGKRARNEYPYRDEYEHELELILKKQGYDTISWKDSSNSSFAAKVWKAIIWQRPLRSQKSKVGKCMLEPKSPRIPISHPLFEIFRTWQYINTIKTVDDNGEKKPIPKEYRIALMHDVFLEKDKSFKFSVLKAYLDKKFRIKMKYNYLNKRTGKYDSTVSGMPVCKALIGLFDEKDFIKEALLELYKFEKVSDIPKVTNGYSVHDLWHIVFDCTDLDYLKDFAEEKLGIESYVKILDGKKIRNNIFSDIHSKFVQGYGDLSAKAIKKIIPFLKEGFLYNEAVVLAKLPELMGESWAEKREIVFQSIKSSSELYAYKSDIVNITNGLVNKYKGLEYDTELRYHPKDKYYGEFYTLDKEDIDDIENSCKSYFGDKTWEQKRDRERIIEDVKREYQLFFRDSRRSYLSKPTQTDLFKQALKDIGVEVEDKLYHHSDRPNLYPKPVYSRKHQMNLLVVPLIDSIKNPMFNKAMSILRKLINELLIQGKIDEDTEIIVEVARELNDNNKRAAIEKYQNERKRNREKYRQFIEEFNSQNSRQLNVIDRIDDFELWTEQIFEEAVDEQGSVLKNNSRLEILAEKDAVKRYELWMEQKGQCMYTGKMISITQLFSNEIDVEHTIPRSLLPDNTKANQTVCFSKYNSDVKNNRIPYECPNFDIDDHNGTAILPRLTHWEKVRDHYQELYDRHKKPKGNEDENAKNTRIVNKHYFKMHLDYWKDKINRFTCDEIKDSWVRRQLTDTQMVTKYAREFLKTYFKKVSVEKGSITAEFRKIYGFQEENEIKARNKHTHHAIDAAVLTLIPNNASRKKELLKKAFKFFESYKKQYNEKPFPDFSAQQLINDIENSTLIFNHTKDKIISTTYKKVRKRGVIQKNEDGTIRWMRGDSIRGDLYGQTFISKSLVAEMEDEKPKRDENGNIILKRDKKGNTVFMFSVRKPIEEVKSKYISNIVDPDIRSIVSQQKKNGKVYDHQGKEIRHVRVKTKAGKVVKERTNYRSRHQHKNFFYASAGEIPYAVMLEKISNGKVVDRKLLPVAIHEVVKVFKAFRKFNTELYFKFFHDGLMEQYDNIRLLRVSQKVLVLKSENELEEVADINFQRNRFYYITQFEQGKILLKHHLETKEFNDYKKHIKSIKDEILLKIEKDLGLPTIKEDDTIVNRQDRKKDFEDRRYKDLNKLSGYRISRIAEILGDDKTKDLLENELNVYKAQSGELIEGKTPFLGLTQKRWIFLYEGEHFEIDILGHLRLNKDFV